MNRDTRWEEWTEDDRRDRAAAKRAGFDDVDQWVQALNDITDELRKDNDEADKRFYDRLFERARIYGIVK